MKIKLIGVLFFIFGVGFTFAQEIQWAVKVQEFSSQRSPKLFSVQQLLGPPRAIMGNPSSACVWQPSKEESKTEEVVRVKFEKPVFARQIVICEVGNPGAIQKVYTINTGGFEKLIWETDKTQKIKGQTNVWRHVFDEVTKTKVQEVKVVLNTKAVKGYNGIDAIGLSESAVPFEPTINLLDGYDTYKKENLGHSINSPFIEYMPQISPDGKSLYFVRQGHPENQGEGKLDDIWVALSDDGVTWSNAVKAPYPLNDEGPNYIYTITPDGNTLLVGDGDAVNSHGVGKSYKKGNGWSVSTEVKMHWFTNYSKYSEFCLSANKRVLLMTLDDGVSYGDNDIYASFLKKDGTWSKPKNIGPLVNTAGAEASPFLAADGMTLYFSSNGHLGYGKNDIFMTQRLDDTWENWSEPVNLGSVINSEENEFYYSVPASGKYAYFVSKNQTLGESDIFRVELPQSVKPFPVTMVSGRVFNIETDELVQAEIHYDLLPEGADVGQGHTDVSSGEYKIIIPQDHMYGIHAKAEGYFPLSVRIDEENQSDHHYHTITQDLYVAPIRENERFVLNNVNFHRSKSDLSLYSGVELGHLADFLKENHDMKIKLFGHTDGTGYQDWNKKLSLQRVQVVLDYLRSLGVHNEIEIEGRGGADPIVPNDTEENKAKNRRVEVMITQI